MNRAGWLLIAAVLFVLAAAAYNDTPTLIMGYDVPQGVRFKADRNMRLRSSSSMIVPWEGKP